MQYKRIFVHIVIDGKVHLSQQVSRETLDEKIWPLLEEESARLLLEG